MDGINMIDIDINIDIDIIRLGSREVHNGSDVAVHRHNVADAGGAGLMWFWLAVTLQG
ncbi:hypothetical protein TIFTF001_026870 [Ficus carica]|uniref:Uncharacterized protein n=1 Tax=Ficus carica TaxID=3494 RepID=A0AA88DM00_FICCA|nr:hypothetical protein TIFTF001_026870 [Ficus carica]